MPGCARWSTTARAIPMAPAAARRLIDHGKDGWRAGPYSAIGGKWTTSRDLGGKIHRYAGGKAWLARGELHDGNGALARRDHRRLRANSRPPRQRLIHRLPASAISGRLYGAQLPAVLGLAKNRPELLTAIGTTGDIAAQIVHAVREEMALNLEDVVMRRTCIGGLGPPPPEALDRAARIMADECSWRRDAAAERDAVRNAQFSHAGGGMSAFVVVNPRSGNGRTGREWRTHRKRLVVPSIRICRWRSRARAAMPRRLVRRCAK